MNFNAIVPSLERIALIRTAVILWNQDDVRTVMKKCYYPLLHKNRENRLQKNSSWERKWLQIHQKIEKICLEMEEKVAYKVLQLQVPNSLKENLATIIKPIRVEILKWVEFHDCSYIGLDLPSEICWLPQGTVDERKTAKLLIKDEHIDIVRRYKLACIYCLEDSIAELWEKIPSSDKKKIYSKEGPEEVEQQALVVFWTYSIMGELDKWEKMIKKRMWRDPYQCAIEYAAMTRNKAAIGYFLQKLTSAQRERYLMKCAVLVVQGPFVHLDYDLPRKNHADVLKFLLSLMNSQQQLEVLQNYPSSVLWWCLEWPWQEFFMEVANSLWPFLLKLDIYSSLHKIVEKVQQGYKDYNYKYLFREFWLQSPIYHAQFIKDYIVNGILLEYLFCIEDKGNIRLILADAFPVDRENIIFSDEGKRICKSLAYADKGDLLKFFVQECLSSKDMMIKFKEEVKKHVICNQTRESLKREKDMWIKLSQLLDDLIQKEASETDLEEGNTSAM